MPKRASLLEQINIPSPCSADWDSMVGNEQVRFCQHCSLSVHDLTKITRKEITRLVASSKGKLCVRYYRRPDGLVQTAASAQPLTQIKRRLSRLAAGVFTASLSLASSAAAQSTQPTGRNVAAVSEPAGAKDRGRENSLGGQTATLSGLVIDPVKASIPGANVVLINEENGQQQSLTSNDEGAFQFQGVAAGSYTLKIESPGFISYAQEKINLRNGAEERVEATLEAGQVVAMGGAIMVMPDTPLINAIWEDNGDENLTEVKSVLATGVDVNLLDKNVDSTALAEAVASGKLALVQLLLNFGADPNERNSTGRTPLMRLDEDSSAEIVRALVNAGANPNRRDEDGDTALMAAASLEKVELLNALLDAGAKVNARNKEGKTALMVASEGGYVENVRALLEAGADVNRKNKEGASALKYAKEGEHSDVVEVLTFYGAIE